MCIIYNLKIIEKLICGVCKKNYLFIFLFKIVVWLSMNLIIISIIFFIYLKG